MPQFQLDEGGEALAVFGNREMGLSEWGRPMAGPRGELP